MKKRRKHKGLGNDLNPQPRHSKGPWRIQRTSRPHYLQIVDADGDVVAVLDATDQSGGSMGDDETLLADAYVLAAAPVLLAACKEAAQEYMIVNCHDHCGLCTPCQLRDAIAMAQPPALRGRRCAGELKGTKKVKGANNDRGHS
ncbi:MAG: hypothetical protein HZA50_13835 [Planctomycetes bacterium]|nr:hypothetical protein [Planctomycetota bacterium]